LCQHGIVDGVAQLDEKVFGGDINVHKVTLLWIKYFGILPTFGLGMGTKQGEEDQEGRTRSSKSL
jgi:hypothetical protein